MSALSPEQNHAVGPQAPGVASGHSAEQVALSTHILSVSATLVGVCLTVIGLIRLVERLRDLRTIEDELLAINALTFLLAAVTSYLALRSRTPAGYRRMERVADVSFLVGLTFMAVVCCLIAYQVV
jgi:uncharacterized membrane protein YhaH (DUF805 family)